MSKTPYEIRLELLNLAKEILQKNNMTKIKESERTLNLDNEQ